MQAEQGSLQENQELTERSKLSIPERVKQLRTEFAGKDIKFTAFHVEGGFIPIDRPEMFPQKPTYIEVDGELKNGSQTEPVRLITPRDLTDANVQFRLMQWAIALRAIDESADDLGAQELLSHFRLPKVIEFHPVDFVKKGTAIGSMMIERVWGKPAGGVHLADPDTFETNDLSRMAGFFDLIRRIGRKHDLTLGEDLYHSHISDRFSDPENNKWWIDFGPRMKFYNEIFGPDFSLAMYKLLISKRTAALFDEKHRNGRELVWGNPIPVNMVITSDQKIGIT